MRSGYAISAPKRSLSDLQKEMDDLSFEERELLYKELYGFPTNTIIETEEMIQSVLNEMDALLRDMMIQNTMSSLVSSSSSGEIGSTTADNAAIRSYIHAYETVPSFVSDPNLRLQFLRCELYNVKVRK